MEKNILPGRFITEKAVVTRVDSLGIHVRPESKCNTAACSTCIQCNKGTFKNPDLLCVADSVTPYTPNQKIKIQRFVINEAIASIILFGIPLLCSMISLIILLETCPSEVNSFKTIVIGATVFISSFTVILIIERILRTHFPIRIIQS